MVDSNIFQEIFLIFYAILFGIMLQSLDEFQPFPLAHPSKYRRVLLSFFILNFLPFLYFIIIFWCLGFLDEHRLITSSITYMYLFISMVSGLGVFAFYRFYHVAAILGKDNIFKDRWDEIEERRGGIGKDWKLHLIWAVIYLTLPIFFIWLVRV